MYTNAVKKRVQVDSAPQSTQIPSVGIIPGGIPNSAMLSMLDNSALAGGGVSDLGTADAGAAGLGPADPKR